MALVPPITFRPTIDRPDKFFTLHTRPNTAFAMRLSDDTKISVVGFRTWGDAYFIGQKLELNYKRTQEWPDIDATQGALVLPAYSGEDALSLVGIREWDLEELKYYCTSNILDLISVEEIKSEDDTYSFAGNMYKFSAPVEFYMERFNEILALEQ